MAKDLIITSAGLEIIEPQQSEFELDKGKKKVLKYGLKNITENSIGRVEISAFSMKHVPETGQYIFTKHNYVKVISKPVAIVSGETKDFEVEADVPEDYKEKAFDPKSQKKREIPYAIKVVAEAKKFIEEF